MEGITMAKIYFTITLGELLDGMLKGHIKSRPPISQLTPTQEKRIRRVWRECAQFWGVYTAFEEFEREICRDVIPEFEIAAWERISKQYRRLKATVSNRAKLINRLVLDSMTGGKS